MVTLAEPPSRVHNKVTRAHRQCRSKSQKPTTSSSSRRATRCDGPTIHGSLHRLTDRGISTFKGSRTPFCATSRPFRSYQTSYGRASGQTVRRTTLIVSQFADLNRDERSQQTLDQPPGSIIRHVRCCNDHQRGRSRTSSCKVARDGIAGPGSRGPSNPSIHRIRLPPDHAQMGDATNTVIIFAGELLKKAEHLLIMGLHPSEIIQGYELACTKALAELEGVSQSE